MRVQDLGRVAHDLPGDVTVPPWLKEVSVFGDECFMSDTRERPLSPDWDVPGFDPKAVYTSTMGEPKNADQVAEMSIAVAVADALHEMIEFTYVNGERYADPHPVGGDDRHWMVKELRSVVRRYRKRYPA